MLLAALLSRTVRQGLLIVRDAAGRERRYGDPATGPTVAIRLTDAKVEGELGLRPGMAFGEAYMDGRLVIEGGSDIRDLLFLLIRNLTSGPHRHSRLEDLIRPAMRRLQQHNSARRSRRNVAHHYDLSDRLYELFLDADRQYSCAYFLDPSDTLEQAQLQKKQHIASKLLLKPGQRVLEIGSGWGGLSLFLAQQYGVDVTGLTLSVEQHAYATERAQRAGMANRVRYELLDYRSAQGTYDRIVSVGMFEHVGITQYDVFFRTVERLLKPEGVALLHSIGRAHGPGLTNSWLRKYIFPGGYSPALSEVMPAVERSGLWSTDIEILRLHYAWTLNAWYARFQAARSEVVALYDERFCRMWEFYLAACEANFLFADGLVFQMQLTRKVDTVPVQRAYMLQEEARLQDAPTSARPRTASMAGND